MVSAATKPTPFYRALYFHVLVGIALGIFVGALNPEVGKAMKPLGDGFIKLIRMVIAPIIFGTVVVGIAKMGDMKSVGRIGAKALIYFEIVSTVALIIGMVIANLAQPGTGVNASAATLDPKAIATYTTNASHLTTVDFILNIIPTTVVDAFARGEILQVLLFSILFGLALLRMGERGRHFIATIDSFTHAMFGVVGMIMWVAAIGSFGAIAYTVSQFGLSSLVSLGKLLLDVVAGCLLFVSIVLAAVSAWAGFNIWKLLKYIKEEILIVLGTSSSETVLPRLMAKLEYLGCAKPVVGLVVPTGYSFNLDGTAIYMSMAAIYIAQATNTSLTTAQQLGILGVLLLTSKGAAAVTGGGFVTLAATLSAVPVLPVAGLGLLLGIDPFMSRARSFTNLVGNAVGAIVIARAEGALDVYRMRRVLNGEPVDEVEVLIIETLVVPEPTPERATAGFR